ncbi:MAG: 8-amino-7-oxononanoate synthase [Planctomycetes bacterium]|nr:8-amino-7-oxononanoate synthase [Planctomycetota bacterium]MBU4400587.1 8-amino-7-oxononanoate synthase [Planctomycetota bacterium]MCG2682032.1 8-amino-7-oxononanoate synthase [Planctomycetales bacterium]
MNPLSWIDDELASLERQHLRRRPLTHEGPQSVRLSIDGRELINFGSNDYLALASDPRLSRAASEAAARVGWGSGASPLVTGRAALHRRLEEQLAEFEGTEAALLFSSGFAANLGAIAALAGAGDAVYCDRKNHASLWDGCRLSRADVRVYPHNDCRRLAELLEASGRCRRRLIVTDGLFSMDGDLAPLAELAELAERHRAMLLVDEAHATGVFGRNGRGAAEHFGVEDRVHVCVGTLSKALGCSGGFVAGRTALIEWLVNRARSYVFSTAAPAAGSAAALAALDVVRDEPQRRESLLARAQALRDELRGQGWNTGASASQIVPVIVGDPRRATALSAKLLERGLFVPAIRPPTVPEGEALLRVSLTAGHTEEMIASLFNALAQYRETETAPGRV